MANIKNMRMWESICTDARISIQNSLFGLRSKAIYTPTNSVIDAKSIEYSPEDGARIKRILTVPYENLATAIGDFHPKTVDYGNYLAEVCASRDGEFLTIQLFQFQQLNYEPVTEVLIFEGQDAAALAHLFVHTDK